MEALVWRLSQPGFDPSYGKLVCQATLMSSDRTKQICLWMTIYIYIYKAETSSSLEKDPVSRAQILNEAGCILHCSNRQEWVNINSDLSMATYLGETKHLLIWFYGISTILRHLMPNPPNTYISNIYDS